MQYKNYLNFWMFVEWPSLTTCYEEKLLYNMHTKTKKKRMTYIKLTCRKFQRLILVCSIFILSYYAQKYIDGCFFVCSGFLFVASVNTCDACNTRRKDSFQQYWLRYKLLSQIPIGFKYNARKYVIYLE